MIARFSGRTRVKFLRGQMQKNSFETNLQNYCKELFFEIASKGQLILVNYINDLHVTVLEVAATSDGTTTTQLTDAGDTTTTTTTHITDAELQINMFYQASVRQNMKFGDLTTNGPFLVVTTIIKLHRCVIASMFRFGNTVIQTSNFGKLI